MPGPDGRTTVMARVALGEQVELELPSGERVTVRLMRGSSNRNVNLAVIAPPSVRISRPPKARPVVRAMVAALLLAVIGCGSPIAPAAPARASRPMDRSLLAFGVGPAPAHRVRPMLRPDLRFYDAAPPMALDSTCTGHGVAVLARVSGFGKGQDGEWPAPLGNGDFYETTIVTPAFTTYIPTAYWWADPGGYGESHAYTSRFRIEVGSGPHRLVIEGPLACSGAGIDGDGRRWWFYDLIGITVNGVSVPYLADDVFDHRMVVGRWTVYAKERGPDFARALRVVGAGRREVVIAETAYRGCP